MFKENKSEEIINILKDGGIGILPTDTIYGLVGRALDPETVERIYEVRKRRPDKPFIILISSIADLKLFNIKINKKTKTILKKYWPGPVSIILPCSDEKFYYLHRGTKTLAFRLPLPSRSRAELNARTCSHSSALVPPWRDSLLPVAHGDPLMKGRGVLGFSSPFTGGSRSDGQERAERELMNATLGAFSVAQERLGGGNLIKILKQTGPLVAPSANPEGLEPAKTVKQAKKYFNNQVDFYFDVGRMESAPSTLIKIVDDKIEVLREGAVKI
ncbi:L-threonylcarbamoyladenylate synthase [Candidatus Falkowbacteria bacterium]|nr:L-threonylcarbamoyladenylate synthase [Candidatus Falkowbacteria bacterium]